MEKIISKKDIVTIKKDVEGVFVQLCYLTEPMIRELLVQCPSLKDIRIWKTCRISCGAMKIIEESNIRIQRYGAVGRHPLRPEWIAEECKRLRKHTKPRPTYQKISEILSIPKSLAWFYINRKTS